MVVLKEEEEEEEEQSMAPASSPTTSATESITRADAKQAIQCPRCHSFNTKFCYFNNYNTTQPRHFCKNCTRYWTHGGALRNVPVGGGSKKNKRPKVGCTDQKSREAGQSFSYANSSPKSATSALLNEEEVGGGRGRGGEAGTQRMPFNEEHHIKRCRTEQHSFIPSLPFQLHGLPYFDSTILAFTSSPSQTSFDLINDGLSQTNTQSNSDIGPGSLIDSIVPSDVGPSLVDCILPDSECNKYHHDHPLIQQTEQQVINHSPIPADQTLTDEKGRKHVIGGVSDEIFDQMRDNFSIQGSKTFLYDVKNVASEWQIGLEDHFDPTNDLCYMGGPEIWSDFSPFDGGSGTVI